MRVASPRRGLRRNTARASSSPATRNSAIGKWTRLGCHLPSQFTSRPPKVLAAPRPWRDPRRPSGSPEPKGRDAQARSEGSDRRGRPQRPRSRALSGGLHGRQQDMGGLTRRSARSGKVHAAGAVRSSGPFLENTRRARCPLETFWRRPRAGAREAPPDPGPASSPPASEARLAYRRFKMAFICAISRFWEATIPSRP